MVWEVPKGSGKIGIINQTSHAGWLPQLGNYEYLLNILIVLALTIFMYVYLKYSKHGYELSVVGESENTAKYIGINVKKVIIRTMLLSGAVCGIAGLLLVGGTDHTITSLLLVFFDKGATEIATVYRLNESFSEIITGIILFFIIGSEFFINYKINFRKSHKEGE